MEYAFKKVLFFVKMAASDEKAECSFFSIKIFFRHFEIKINIQESDSKANTLNSYFLV